MQYDVFGPLPTPVEQQWYFNPLTPPYVPAVQTQSPTTIFSTPLQTAASTNNDCSYPAIIGDNPEDLQRQLAILLEWTRDPGCTMTEEGKFLAQVEIYKELLYHSDLMSLGTSYDALLQDFFDDEASTNVGAMAHVRYYIDTEEYEDAESENSSITPENQAAENEAKTNQIYLDTWAQSIYTFTTLQYNTLLDIAEQNPISGGPAVYTARVMLGVDYDDFSNIEARLSTEKQLTESFMSIFPNPASDELNIAYSLGDNEEGIFLLSDLVGREVFRQELKNRPDKLIISAKAIEQGVYFAQIKVNNEAISIEKLVIVK